MPPTPVGISSITLKLKIEIYWKFPTFSFSIIFKIPTESGDNDLILRREVGEFLHFEFLFTFFLIIKVNKFTGVSNLNNFMIISRGSSGH